MIWSHSPSSSGEQGNSANGFTPKLTEEYFGKPDGSKPVFSRHRAHHHFWKAGLAEGSTAEHPVWALIWRQPGKTELVEGVRFEAYRTFSSPPLENRAEVPALRKASAGGDDSFREAVEWSEVKKKDPS